MKKIFNLLGGLTIAALLVVSYTSAYTQEQYDAYKWAYKYGITTQPNIDAANLNGNITRQAFTKMIVNYLENVVGVKQSTSKFCFFPDEGTITSDLKPYAKKTCAYGIMGENGTKFNPKNSLTRAQLGTVLSRILWGDKYNLDGNGYYLYHLNALKDNGIMNNIGNASKTYTKRGDVLVMLKRMYEKYGSNIYLNNGNQGQTSIIQNKPKSSTTIEDLDDNELDNDYISSAYSNSNVIYLGKDGTKYYYDDKFLAMLRDTAEKKGESDLADYLKVETEYFKDGLDQLADLDDEDGLKAMGIDLDSVDPDNMTKQEKQEFMKKFKIAFGKIVDENKDKNEKLVKDLGKITKNIKNDKFGLEEKYKKTKTFMETSNNFLDLYSESIVNLMEIALMKDSNDENSEEGIAQAFGLITVALAYQGAAQEYQEYIEKWGADTVKLLDGLNTRNATVSNNSQSSKSSLIFFYGNTCSNCRTEAGYLLELQKTYDFDIKGYEVYNNNDNLEIMKEYSDKLGATFNGVPVVIMGDDFFLGANYEKTVELLEKHATKK